MSLTRNPENNLDVMIVIDYNKFVKCFPWKTALSSNLACLISAHRRNKTGNFVGARAIGSGRKFTQGGF